MLTYAQPRKFDTSKSMFDSMGWKVYPYVWPLYTDGQPATFYTRIVILFLNIPNYNNSTLEQRFIATGIMLDHSRILTAYNPFREFLRDKKLLEKIMLMMLTGFREKNTRYLLQFFDIVCGRQIVYMPDDEKNQWHDTDRKHSPLHDLMVLRMEEEITYTPMGTTNYDQHPPMYHRDMTYNGASFSYLADRNDQVDSNVRYCSLGFKTVKDMQEYDKLHDIQFEAEFVDCDEWIPRDWGHFICILNTQNLAGVGSGGVLYIKNKVYGIASFAMFRKEVGILVFTDVRQYNELIMKTCGDEEFL